MWAVRTDFRTMLVGFGGDPNANSFINAGVIWHWGANVPPKWIAVDGTKDSDGDGLTDVDEVNKYRTDPYDPDTDKDDLTDGEEVLKYKTDPLNPDTDMDLLKDGEEVKVQLTDPKDPDTDDGGVIDGHEVLEDFTNPRAGHGNDDLVLYTLYIDFDTDKADLKPKFHPPIDIIGKELARNPTWTARIEGHADQRRKSLPDYNVKLSDRRAASVLDYLDTSHKVDRARMKSKGYGFSRPKVKNNLDAADGTPENRRVEVYIRKGPEPTGPLAVVPDKVEAKVADKAVIEKKGATPAAKPADKKDVAAGMVPVSAPVSAPVGPQAEDK
jgi:outer membrane protein OmpA-like peptidoglycan-associated protein